MHKYMREWWCASDLLKFIRKVKRDRLCNREGKQRTISLFLFTTLHITCGMVTNMLATTGIN